MSEELLDLSFMRRQEIVQAIRNAESLDKAGILMNGYAANGWLHLWDNAKHPDGSSVQEKWQSSQQATIDRLAKGLVKISEMCPYDKDFNQLDEHPINQIRGTIAEVGDTARSLIAEIEAGK